MLFVSALFTVGEKVTPNSHSSPAVSVAEVPVQKLVPVGTAKSAGVAVAGAILVMTTVPGLLFVMVT